VSEIQAIEKKNGENGIFKPLDILYVVNTLEAVKKYFEIKDFLKLDKNTNVFTFLLNEKYQAIHFSKISGENDDSTNK